MRPNTVRLEDSEGRVVESPSEEAVRATVGAIGSSVDHCILDLGEAGFVQAAAPGFSPRSEAAVSVSVGARGAALRERLAGSASGAGACEAGL